MIIKNILLHLKKLCLVKHGHWNSGTECDKSRHCQSIDEKCQPHVVISTEKSVFCLAGTVGYQQKNLVESHDAFVDIFKI